MKIANSKIATSMLWVAVEKFGYSGINFISTIVLARLLTPEDYGVIGVLAVFIAFSQMIVESGLGGALVKKKDVQDKDYSTIFIFNLSCSIILYCLLLIVSPYIANYYDKPILKKIVWVLGLVVIINALTLTQRVHLTRELQFKKQTLISVVALLIAVVFSIGIASLGFGVWALVFQQLIYSLSYFVLIFMIVRFKPKLVFSKKSFKEMYDFGSKLFLSSLLQVLYNDGISAIIAKLYTLTITGLYYQAKKLVDFPVNIFRSLGDNVVFSVLSRVENEKDFQVISSKMMRGITILSFPVFVLVFFFSDQVVYVVLGAQWIKSGEILKILSISSIALIIDSINRNIVKAVGIGNIILKSEAYKKIIGVIIIIIFINFNLLIFLCSIVVSSFIGCLINMYFVHKYTAYSFFQQLKDIVPALMLSISSGVLVKYSLMFIEGNEYVTIIVAFILLLIYSLSLAFIFRLKETEMIKRLIKR